MATCPVCLEESSQKGFRWLSEHMLASASRADAAHVMWLNANVSKQRMSAGALAESLGKLYDLSDAPLSSWIKRKHISRFLGEPPHPFIAAMQRPSRTVLLGYVFEHNHFLKQWVKSCAYILAKTDEEDVQKYEIENISTEFYGYGDSPSHRELLIRMGEELGVPRSRIESTPPLKATADSMLVWNRIARDLHWVSAMAAMHGMELTADHGLVEEGAKSTYFNPSILTDGSIPQAAANFLREGYKADKDHSSRALEMVDKYSVKYGVTEQVQSAFLCSMDALDRYLVARLERGKMFEA
ncbi:MAG: C2H2 type zinc finger domain-containing protein [Thermoprotei archaeon]